MRAKFTDVMRHDVHPVAWWRIRVAVAFVTCILPVALCGADLPDSPQPGLVQTPPQHGRFVETARGMMVAYESTIPGTEVAFTMVPIPGGKFMMGSPDTEKGRAADEGPQLEVEVPPFWMGTHEVTWAEYQQYMALHDVFLEFESKGIRKVTNERAYDAITAPSKLYDPDATYESGDDPRQPAVMMTQYAARQYTKWLAGVTGQFYRLPSEAEWEYACRADTATAYSFGNDVARLDAHAWYQDNAEDRTHRVGQKTANGWGLHDMHGNVAEWVLDAYTADGYQSLGRRSVKAADAIKWPTAPYPLVVRGGSWESESEACRSSSRLGSDDERWKDEDPNLPLSPWWCTTSPATGVGFRILRPLDAPRNPEARERYWKAEVRELAEDVKIRISQQSGAAGIVDKDLPKAVHELTE